MKTIAVSTLLAVALGFTPVLTAQDGDLVPPPPLDGNQEPAPDPVPPPVEEPPAEEDPTTDGSVDSNWKLGPEIKALADANHDGKLTGKERCDAVDRLIAAHKERMAKRRAANKSQRDRIRELKKALRGKKT